MNNCQRHTEPSEPVVGSNHNYKIGSYKYKAYNKIVENKKGKEKRMSKKENKSDWWDEHVTVMTTSGDKKLEEQLNKTLKEKAIKHFAKKPIKRGEK